MKVLVFTTVFPSAGQPLHGLFVAERVRHAARLAEIAVVSPVSWRHRRATPQQTHYASLAVEHPTFFYLPGLFKCLDGVWLFLSALARVRSVQRGFDFDLIDAHFAYPDGVAAMLLGQWFGRPVAITLRGSELELARHRLRAAAMRWALKRAARVITVSSELAVLARRLGAPAGRVQVIANGVDADRFSMSERMAARRALGINGSGPLLVAAGHLAPVKGFHLFIEALPALIAARPGLRFVVVGGPPAAGGRYPARLAAAVMRLGLQSHVTITGPVSPHLMSQWLSAADLFVLPSEREGSSNALREALACGCPAVASDVGDVAQVLTEDAGVLVRNRKDLQEWRRAVLAALDRPWSREAIRNRAATHTWTRVAEAVATEWRGCLGTGCAS